MYQTLSTLTLNSKAATLWQLHQHHGQHYKSNKQDYDSLQLRGHVIHSRCYTQLKTSLMDHQQRVYLDHLIRNWASSLRLSSHNKNMIFFTLMLQDS